MLNREKINVVCKSKGEVTIFPHLARFLILSATVNKYLLLCCFTATCVIVKQKMGNYSWFFGSRNGAKECRIVWATCPPFRSCYMEPLNELREKAESSTVHEIGEAFNDHKLFTYLCKEVVHDLIEVNKRLSGGSEYTPRIYYELEGWSSFNYLEFYPGTETVMTGSYEYDSSRLPPRYGDDEVISDANYDRVKEEEMEEAYNTTMKRLQEEAIADVSGWSVQKLEPVEDDAPGSALGVVLMFAGINPSNAKAVEKFAREIGLAEFKKLSTMRASDLAKH